MRESLVQNHLRVVEDGASNPLVLSGGERTTRSPSVSQSQQRKQSVLHVPTIDPDLSYRDSCRASSLCQQHDDVDLSGDFGKIFDQTNSNTNSVSNRQKSTKLNRTGQFNSIATDLTSDSKQKSNSIKITDLQNSLKVKHEKVIGQPGGDTKSRV